ncbi:MAG: hypothetical protein ACAI43_00880, partial [Phycisphaerae bacterium]|nr:hypothetical protein [Tepidisphaeraceae bacterium]
AGRPDPSRRHRPSPGPTVERVRFHDAETGLAVRHHEARGPKDLTTVIGTQPEVGAGERATRS